MRQELELARRIDHQDRRGKISGTTLMVKGSARNQDDRRENIGVGENVGLIKRE